jgi:hypothetical protein
MASEIDMTLNATSEAIVDEANISSRVESDIPAASSSSNAAAKKMVNNTTPVLTD